jgi:hypothetical protein
MIAAYRDVSFLAGGVSYTFRWGTNATVLLERETKEPATKFFQRLSTDASITDLVLVMYCGLARHHGDLTKEKVGDLIDEIGGPEKIIEIFTQAMPQGEAKPANPPRQKASGTGKGR